MVGKEKITEIISRHKGTASEYGPHRYTVNLPGVDEFDLVDVSDGAWEPEVAFKVLFPGLLKIIAVADAQGLRLGLKEAKRRWKVKGES